MQFDHDVIVAGGGIAGVLAASSVARHSKQNLNILVIDRNPQSEMGKKTGGGWVCGDAVSKGSLDFLEKNVGIKYGKPELERNVRGVVAYSPDHQSKAMFDGEGYILNRRLLPEKQRRDAEKLGVQFLFNTYADSLLAEEGFIRGVQCRSAKDNSTFRKTAKAVVDATGSASRLRTSLPIKSFIQKEIDKEQDIESTGRYIITFEVAKEDKTYFDPDYAIIHLDQNIAPGGYAWVFPKGENKANVGLGVAQRILLERNRVQGRNDTLSSLIEDYVRLNPAIKNWKLAAGREDEGNSKGNWQVPIRRQNDCLVANGYMIVGDAAWMPRPIDAGGIGPAIYASTIAGSVVAEALEAGDVSERGLWKFNVDYVRTYGNRMASSEVLRRFLQRLSNEDLNYGMKHFLSQDDVDRIIKREQPEFKRAGQASKFLWALPRLGLAKGLQYTSVKNKQLIQHYANYPQSPDGFTEWHNKFMADLREAYAKFA
jgi:digeranylgeranylglycerophospholipid reductase